MRGRGQTQLDYLVGISILLLTLTGVFMFVPGIYQTFDNPVDNSERTAADRVAENLIRASVIDGTEKTLNYSELDYRLGTNWTTTVDQAGVPISRDVNVTVENGTSNGRLLLSNGTSYVDNRAPAAQSTRLVQFRNDSRCQPLCRLTVRVWFDEG